MRATRIERPATGVLHVLQASHSYERMAPRMARLIVRCICEHNAARWNRIAQSSDRAKEQKGAHKVFAAHEVARKRQSNAVYL